MALTKFKDQFVDTSKIYQYDGYWFPVSVKETTLNKIKETSFSAQDVFVATYPKSGKNVLYSFNIISLFNFQPCCGSHP